MVKNSSNEKTYVVGTHAPTIYVTENKEENYLEIYIFQVSCTLSLPLLNIPNCQSVLTFLSSTANCLYLYDNYIHELPLC